MRKYMMSTAAAFALGLMGTATADDGNSFSYSSTWGSGSAQSQTNGGTTSDNYGTTCGTGGWDAPGGGIPSGCTTGAPVSSSASPIGTDLPDAQPGECFARIVIPAVYDDVPQTVTSQEAYQALDVTTASFSPDSVNVKTRDEGTKYVVRQPRYEVRTEQVLVKPAYERLTVIPAQFTMVTETVTVGQPRLVWKPGRNLSATTRTDPNTGAVYCLVEEPAKTATVQKRVMTQPEQVRTEMIPAQYETVTKQVLTDPGGVDQIPIPAEYRDIPVQRLAQAAQQMQRQVAPQMQTIMTKVLRAPERFEWAPVLCDTNATHSSISRIQSSLASLGYYNGRIDGVAGPQTQAAISGFQSAQGIPQTGYLTFDTLNQLGLNDLTGQPASSRDHASLAGGQAPMQVRGMAATSTIANDKTVYVQPVASAPTPAPQLRRRLSWSGKN